MKSTTKIITGILVGTAAGLVTGLLTAPNSGKKTRRKMVAKSKGLVAEAKEEMNMKLDRVKDSYNEILEGSAKKTVNGVNTTKETLKA
ncbi:MAG: gas vesicle protein [Roseivirga sp.]|jgi:gas vesicle protein